MSRQTPDSLGRHQTTIFIKEAAVYKLAFRSNKPEADKAGSIVSLSQRPLYEWLRERGIDREQMKRYADTSDIKCDKLVKLVSNGMPTRCIVVPIEKEGLTYTQGYNLLTEANAIN